MSLKPLIIGFAVIHSLYLGFVVLFLAIGDSFAAHIVITAILCFVVSIIINFTYFVFLFKNIINPSEKIIAYANSTEEDATLPENPGVLTGLAEGIDRLHRKIAECKAEKAKVEKNKKELFVTLNSDVRTAIKSISEIAELISTRTEPGKEKQQLEIIRSKANYVDAVIETFSIYDSEQYSEEFSIYLISFESNQLYDMINKVDYDRKCAFVGAIPECKISADINRLEQVFEHVISNAYKYAKTKITVHSELRDTDLIIVIRDYGNGLDPEEIPRVFEKYYRGSNSEDKKGEGLGLFWAYKYMQKMDGRLTCENITGGFAVNISIKLAEQKITTQLEF